MNGLFDIVEFLAWRIIFWSIEIALQLSLAIIRAAMPVLEELVIVAARVTGRLLQYPESWAIIGVFVLWCLTDHGIIATSIGLTAAAAVLIVSLVRTQVW